MIAAVGEIAKPRARVHKLQAIRADSKGDNRACIL
jgi:hypothetical protein